MQPNQEFKMTQQFNVTASTCGKVETSNAIVVTDVCDPLKPEDSKSGKQRRCI